MATTRPFSYNPPPTPPITGTMNVGTLCIGVSPLAYSAKPGGLDWWMGPDEDNSYVIAKDVSAGNFPTELGSIGNVQFWRSTNTDEAFRGLVQTISGTSQASAKSASAWLLTYGYWTNYDAQAFISAAGITNATQKTAIDTLVNGLKADSLWGKMLAVYPFISGTDGSKHKWNLKDPRDLNEAYRLNFQGGWTFSDNGVTPNGTTTYANTYFIPSNIWTGGSSSMSAYSRTNNVETGNLWGTRTGSTATLFTCTLKSSGNTAACNHNANSTTTIATSTSAVNIISSRISTSAQIQGINGTNQSNAVNENSSFSTNPIYLSAINFSGTPSGYSTRELAFAHIGTGLTQAECTLLYNRIQTFQTTLNRQV